MERSTNIYFNTDWSLVEIIEGKTSFINQPTNLLYKKTIVA